MQPADNQKKNTTPDSIDTPLPLVLDVDNTLLRTDLLHECAVSFLKGNPFRIVLILWWLWQGKATLKRQLAQRVSLDFSALPVNPDLENFALHQHTSGRRVGLATAADELLATRLAERFHFVDFVLASDGQRNLKGTPRLRRSRRAFQMVSSMQATAAPISTSGGVPKAAFWSMPARAPRVQPGR